MARMTFDVIDICEIFTHWHAGRFDERDRRRPGGVAEHGPQVRGGGGGCRDDTGRAAGEAAAVGGAGARVVS
jgi:hypothetical protein